MTVQQTPPPAPLFEKAKPSEYNRNAINFRKPMPRPKVRGPVIDFHCHLLARRHAEAWFEAADHYGIDYFLSMTPLEEVVDLLRDFAPRIQFIAVPRFRDDSPNWVDDWRRRLDMFYNLGSRMMKFHAAPQTMAYRGHRLDEPIFKPLFQHALDHKVAIMTHIGDPQLWYNGKYLDTAKYGTREEHYQMWERLLTEYRGTPWVGAHMGGNPEDLPRLQSMLDRFPDLMLDCSATRWMVREISQRRDAAREFFIRNQDRLIFGSDQVSGDDRGFDFLASRFWSHRKLWETAYIGETPILDPDLPKENQPTLRGLALPDDVLQKLYHDNATSLLARIGMPFGSSTGWG
jgi:predicted TIM-barrel fold metal-dependent hydrolase